MVFDVISIFPAFFRGMLEQGLLKRAADAGQVTIRLLDLRNFTDDRHRTVDDRPFGGGPGMVFKPEPLFRAVEALHSDSSQAPFPVILMSAQGRLLKQSLVEELAREPRVTLICGRYEGVDERVAQHLATLELAIGDYVLSGGELAAAVVMEAVTRLLPGVLGNQESATQESFAPVELGDHPERRCGAPDHRDVPRLLDCPHYTRPVDFRGWRVPEVLLSGNHREISRWRRRQALAKTWQNRPELLDGLPLSAEDATVLADLRRRGSDQNQNSTSLDG